MTRLAPIVVFSAAIPFQGGDGHINEQWPSFWSDLFAARGYSCLADLRHRVWTNPSIEIWYRQNLLCFVAADLRRRLPWAKGMAPDETIDVVHPELYLRVACLRARTEPAPCRLAGQMESTAAGRAEGVSTAARIRETGVAAGAVRAGEHQKLPALAPVAGDEVRLECGQTRLCLSAPWLSEQNRPSQWGRSNDDRAAVAFLCLARRQVRAASMVTR